MAAIESGYDNDEDAPKWLPDNFQPLYQVRSHPHSALPSPRGEAQCVIWSLPERMVFSIGAHLRLLAAVRPFCALMC